MNFWTFLDRNLLPLLFFLVLPMLIMAGVGGPAIIKAWRTPPICTEAK